jgi:tRNA G37 N-methylase Trm5
VCAVLNGKRVALKSHISSDGFRTPNVQLMWGDSSWVVCVDNEIRYGLFSGSLIAASKL